MATCSLSYNYDHPLVSVRTRNRDVVNVILLSVWLCSRPSAGASSGGIADSAIGFCETEICLWERLRCQARQYLFFLPALASSFQQLDNGSLFCLRRYYGELLRYAARHHLIVIGGSSKPNIFLDITGRPRVAKASDKAHLAPC
jgi:hypothetical protein